MLPLAVRKIFCWHLLTGILALIIHGGWMANTISGCITRNVLMRLVREKYTLFLTRAFIVTVSVFLAVSLSCVDDGGIQSFEVYHSYDMAENLLFEVSKKYPDITSLQPIGPSVEGRTIWALVISDKPDENEQEPRVRLVGSIHGDENITTEILLKFIEYVTANYYSNQYIKGMIDSRYIVVIPMLNPDGLEQGTRYNANDVDLNRNFDVAWTHGENHGSSPFSEIETSSFGDYSSATIFHLSATFHAGAVLVNMPFDYERESAGIVPGEYSLVKYMAKRYSTSGAFLETEGLLDTRYVDEGTINGGDWYIIYGSLQDWSYVKTGCVDLTIEIYRYNPITSDEILDVFLLNRDSILSYIEAAGIGVYGRVTDGNGNPIPDVRVSIEEGDMVTITDRDGNYHRMLLPGNYVLTFSADGYQDYYEEIEIGDYNSMVLDVSLQE